MPTNLRLRDLAIRFPEVFGRGIVRPLKIGIHRDVQAAYGPELDEKKVLRAISDLTSTRAYLQAVVAGSHRHALDGSPAGVVTQEEAAAARDLLEAPKREQAARKVRSALVKRVEASGLLPRAYMLRENLEERAFWASYQKGLHERAIRVAEREAMVRAFEESGLSVEAYVASHRRVSLERLQRALLKMRGKQSGSIAA